MRNTGKDSMGPDFNNDGRVDGYDMEYLSSSNSSGTSTGCGDFLKFGCLVPAGCLLAISIIMTCFLYACAAFFGY